MRAQDNEAEAETVLTRCLSDNGRESAAAGLLREWLLADRRWLDLDRWLPAMAPDAAAIEDRVLAAVRAHRQGDFATAASICTQVLQVRADHAPALAHRARAEHNLGMTAQALAGLECAVDIDPLYAEGWHSLGIAVRAAGALDRAAEAFERALLLRPGYRRAALDLGKTWLALERAEPAVALLSRWWQRIGDDADIATDLGVALHRLGRMPEAMSMLDTAVALAPEHADAWLHLGALRNHLGDSAGAAAALERALALNPRDADAWSELATLHELDNRLPQMRRALEHGLAVAPQHPSLRLEAARYQRRMGDAQAAASLLRDLDADALPPWRRKDYWFELGRHLDQLQRADDAWDAFLHGNRLAAASAGNDLAFLPRLLDRLHAQLEHAPAVPSQIPSGAGADAGPVFLLGFPRSGLTLLNTMLGCHPCIETLEEKPTLEACVEQLAKAPSSYPESLAGIDDRALDRLRMRYWEQVRRHAPAANRDTRLVDTFPIRTLHVQLIASLFPYARVVFMARHPADVVLSNVMQDYAPNPANAQFTDLQRATATYAGTLELWRKARSRLPLRIHTLRYEDLVRDAEGTLHPLLRFLELPWHPDMLAQYRARAGTLRIGTSSYHQVAEALNDRSIGRWQRYRGPLAPILPRLQPAAADLGYTLG